ncbi:MAG: TetR/AcrR family transcriptional regulator [Maritimibacter sp.]|jgi:AcrR family transcriptional regulator
MSDSNRPHHHGNLRAALIAAGMDLVQEGGPEALSIRQVAARAGVSHAAPAHHFPNLTALRTAIATEAHRIFTATMEQAIAEAPGTPKEAIIAIGIGYLRFARAHPGLFHIMFGGAELDQDDAEFLHSSALSYGVLARVCAPVAHGPAGPRGTETLVWSIAHGFASLTLFHRTQSMDASEAETLFRTIAPDLPIASEQD